jgi:hypothetical protein
MQLIIDRPVTNQEVAMISDWDTSEPFMAGLKDRIQPIGQEYDLREVLAQCFKDCSDLPISGGWGYSTPTAIRFEAKKFKPGLPLDFAGLEHHSRVPSSRSYFVFSVCQT